MRLIYTFLFVFILNTLFAQDSEYLPVYKLEFYKVRDIHNQNTEKLVFKKVFIHGYELSMLDVSRQHTGHDLMFFKNGKTQINESYIESNSLPPYYDSISIKSNERDTTLNIYDEYGYLRFCGEITLEKQEIRLNGWSNWYYFNGVKQEQTYFSNGVKQYTSSKFYKNGNLAANICYENDTISGDVEIFDFEGKLHKQITSNYGCVDISCKEHRNKQKSSKIVEYYPDGKTIQLVTMFENVKNEKYYYPSGQLGYNKSWNYDKSWNNEYANEYALSSLRYYYINGKIRYNEINSDSIYLKENFAEDGTIIDREKNIALDDLNENKRKYFINKELYNQNGEILYRKVDSTSNSVNNYSKEINYKDNYINVHYFLNDKYISYTTDLYGNPINLFKDSCVLNAYKDFNSCFYGLTNKSNSIKLEAIYDEIKRFNKNTIPFYKVTLQNKVGILDYTGKIIIPCIYSQVIHQNEFLIVKLGNNQVGVVDYNNQALLPCQYSDIYIKNDSVVLYKGKIKEIKHINSILPVRCRVNSISQNPYPSRLTDPLQVVKLEQDSSLFKFYYPSFKLRIVKENGYVGVKDENDKLIIPIIYKSITPYFDFYLLEKDSSIEYIGPDLKIRNDMELLFEIKDSSNITIPLIYDPVLLINYHNNDNFTFSSSMYYQITEISPRFSKTDLNGKIIISPCDFYVKYKECELFTKDSEQFLFNKNHLKFNNRKLKFSLENIDKYDQVVVISSRGLLGLYDLNKQKIVLDTIYAYIAINDNFENKNQYWVKLNNVKNKTGLYAWSLIDIDSKSYIFKGFDYPFRFPYSSYPYEYISKNGLLGVYSNDKKQMLFDCIYKEIKPQFNGLKFVKNTQNKWGVMDKEGKIISPPIWDKMTPYLGEYAFLIQNKPQTIGILDLRGKIIKQISQIQTSTTRINLFDYIDFNYANKFETENNYIEFDNGSEFSFSIDTTNSSNDDYLDENSEEYETLINNYTADIIDDYLILDKFNKKNKNSFYEQLIDNYFAEKLIKLNTFDNIFYNEKSTIPIHNNIDILGVGLSSSSNFEIVNFSSTNFIYEISSSDVKSFNRTIYKILGLSKNTFSYMELEDENNFRYLNYFIQNEQFIPFKFKDIIINSPLNYQKIATLVRDKMTEHSLNLNYCFTDSQLLELINNNFSINEGNISFYFDYQKIEFPLKELKSMANVLWKQYIVL